MQAHSEYGTDREWAPLFSAGTLALGAGLAWSVGGPVALSALPALG